MHRRTFLTWLIASPCAYAGSFEEYARQQQGAFNDYKTKVNEEFNEYLRIMDEEFSHYKKSLSKYWSTPAISSNHRWIQYSSDLTTRSVVDFENETLTVESVAETSQARQDAIKIHLKNIAGYDVKRAINNDQLLSNIESRLSDFNHVIHGNINKDEPILGQNFIDELTNASRYTPINKYGFMHTAVTSGNISNRFVRVSNNQAQANGHSSDKIDIKLPSKFLTERANKQKPIVHDKSSAYHVNFSALMSLMHTESSFNPMALSDTAYGLMMINPSTSGKLAHKKAYGEEKILAPSFLYNNVNNIELGAVYFNILFHESLKNITNPVSRLYCAIVSYNAGLGNVARTFTSRPVLNKAIDVINTLEADTVYKTFQDKLAFEESKIYLTKVRSRLSFYLQENEQSYRALKNI